MSFKPVQQYELFELDHRIQEVSRKEVWRLIRRAVWNPRHNLDDIPFLLKVLREIGKSD